MLPSEGALDPIVFRPDIIEYPVRRARYDDYGF